MSCDVGEATKGLENETASFTYVTWRVPMVITFNLTAVANIIRSLKSRRLRRAGHVVRMEPSRIAYSFSGKT